MLLRIVPTSMLLKTIPMPCSQTLVIHTKYSLYIHSKYFPDSVSTTQLKPRILTNTFGLLLSKSYTRMRSTIRIKRNPLKYIFKVRLLKNTNYMIILSPLSFVHYLSCRIWRYEKKLVRRLVSIYAKVDKFVVGLVLVVILCLSLFILGIHIKLGFIAKQHNE